MFSLLVLFFNSLVFFCTCQTSLAGLPQIWKWSEKKHTKCILQGQGELAFCKKRVMIYCNMVVLVPLKAGWNVWGHCYYDILKWMSRKDGSMLRLEAAIRSDTLYLFGWKIFIGILKKDVCCNHACLHVCYNCDSYQLKKTMLKDLCF